MPATTARPEQVRGYAGTAGDFDVTRADLRVNSASAGTNVIAKAIQGIGILLSSTGADAGTGDVTISISQSSDLQMAASQSIILSTATTNAGVNCLVLGANTSGTPANNLGAGLNLRAETSTTNSVDQATIASGWSDVNHATRTAYLDFSLVNNATATASKMRLFGSGALSVGTTTDPAANGIVNVATGFRIANAAASGKILIGDGTNYIASTPTWPTTAGTAGQMVQSTGTNWVASGPTWPTSALSAGRVVRSDGTNFASTILNFSDLTGQATVAQGGLNTSTAPTAGQQIRASSATAYGPVTTTFAFSTPVNIAALATTSTSIMGGLAGSITPKYSGTVYVVLCFRGSTGTAGAYCYAQLRYSTGTAPIKGATLIGTPVGNASYSQTVGSSVNSSTGMSCQAIITGLTVNTAYWIDIAIGSSASVNTSLSDFSLAIIEL
jgi:hypothetical protein